MGAAAAQPRPAAAQRTLCRAARLVPLPNVVAVVHAAVKQPAAASAAAAASTAAAAASGQGAGPG